MHDAQAASAMRIIRSPHPEKHPRILVINPNSTENFSKAMHAAFSGTSCELDFYTPPTETSPASIEGSYDGVVSAAACLAELKDKLGEWEGYIVACFSAHPLTHALRELTSSPVVGILEAPLQLAANLGVKVGILTTSPRWEPLLTHDVHALHLSSLNAAGVVSSGLSVLDLEHLPREKVLEVLGTKAREELQEKRGADVIVLGCAGMVGSDKAVQKACKEGMVVIDPVGAAIEVCESLIRLGLKTSKIGMYAAAK